MAAAIADAMDCFDDERPVPPPPQERDIVGTRYASQLLAVVEEDGRAAIHRRRAITGPGDNNDAVVHVVAVGGVGQGDAHRIENVGGVERDTV